MHIGTPRNDNVRNSYIIVTRIITFGSIVALNAMTYYLGCVSCDKTYLGQEIRYRCDCGEILEVRRTDFPELKSTISRELFKKRRIQRDGP